MKLKTIKKQLGVASLKRADTADELNDSMLESSEQRSTRLHAQLAHDRERARKRKEFERKTKKEKPMKKNEFRQELDEAIDEAFKAHEALSACPTKEDLSAEFSEVSKRRGQVDEHSPAYQELTSRMQALREKIEHFPACNAGFSEALRAARKKVQRLVERI